MAHVRSKLGNRIYLPIEFRKTVIPPDADKWRQSDSCGTISPRYEAKREAELTSLTEPGDNPFKFNSSYVMCVLENSQV